MFATTKVVRVESLKAGTKCDRDKVQAALQVDKWARSPVGKPVFETIPCRIGEHGGVLQSEGRSRSDLIGQSTTEDTCQ